MLGLSPVTVQIYAERYGVGKKLGRDWLFGEEDIRIIKERQERGRGRPPLDKEKKGKS